MEDSFLDLKATYEVKLALPDKAEQASVAAGVPSFLAAHIASMQKDRQFPVTDSRESVQRKNRMEGSDGMEAALQLVHDHLDNSRLFGSEASLSNIEASHCSEQIIQTSKPDSVRAQNRLTEFQAVAASK